MSWKKSPDGGLDFDVSIEQKSEKVKEEFNPFATAFTSTFDLNFEELPVPPRNGAKERLAKFRKRKYGR